MKQLEDDVKPLFLAMILDAPTSRGSGDTNPTRNLGHKNARGMSGDRLRIQELAIDDWSRAAQVLSDARRIRAVPTVGSIRV